MASEAREATARCHCGAVEIVAAFPSRFCVHCYCRSCRTTHASGVVTWIGFPRSQVSFRKGAELLADYRSSPGTHRRYCSRCGTRMTFESERGRWSEEVHLPLAVFTTAVDRAPSGNSFAEERPAWSPYLPHADD